MMWLKRCGVVAAILALVLFVTFCVAGCTAADALMNRDKLAALIEEMIAERDTEISKTQPPAITQTAPPTGEGGGGPQVMVFGDKVLAELSAMVKYFSSTAQERQTDLMQRTKSKLNLLGFAVASVVIVLVVGLAWRKTAKARKAARDAIEPIVTKIKALVARLKETTDEAEVGKINAEIVSLNSLKADAEKKAAG